MFLRPTRPSVGNDGTLSCESSTVASSRVKHARTACSIGRDKRANDTSQLHSKHHVSELHADMKTECSFEPCAYRHRNPLKARPCAHEANSNTRRYRNASVSGQRARWNSVRPRRLLTIVFDAVCNCRLLTATTSAQPVLRCMQSCHTWQCVEQFVLFGELV
jgi:hypothetical protein